MCKYTHTHTHTYTIHTHTHICIYRQLDQNLMVTANQKSTVDTHTHTHTQMKKLIVSFRETMLYKWSFGSYTECGPHGYTVH